MEVGPGRAGSTSGTDSILPVGQKLLELAWCRRGVVNIRLTTNSCTSGFHPPIIFILRNCIHSGTGGSKHCGLDTRLDGFHASDLPADPHAAGGSHAVVVSHFWQSCRDCAAYSVTSNTMRTQRHYGTTDVKFTRI